MLYNFYFWHDLCRLHFKVVLVRSAFQKDLTKIPWMGKLTIAPLRIIDFHNFEEYLSMLNLNEKIPERLITK
jgi:hypothetical protein